MPCHPAGATVTPHACEVGSGLDFEAVPSPRPTAAEFRDALPEDERGRYQAATVADFVFAAAYAATALALSSPRRRLSVIGAWLIVAGAAADMVENGFVLAGVIDEQGVTDGAVDTMRLFGTLKWAGVVTGLVLMAVAMVQERRGRGQTNGPLP